MKIEQFRQMAEAYGADIALWPVAKQGEAGRLLAASSEAATIIAEAEALDRLLDRAARAITEDDVERVWGSIATRLADAPEPAPLSAWARLRPYLPTSAFLASMLIVGMVAGNWNAVRTAERVALGTAINAHLSQQSYLIAWNE